MTFNRGFGPASTVSPWQANINPSPMVLRTRGSGLAKSNAITFKRRLLLAKSMVHVLETGLEYLTSNNPNGKPAVRGYNIINGQLTSASDAATFSSTNPALLADLVGEFPLSTRNDVHDALHAARDAFPGWAATPAPTRGQIIGNMGRLLMEHKEALVALETREIGKTLKESGGEIKKPSTPVCSSSRKEEGCTGKPSTQNFPTRNCSPIAGRWACVESSTPVIFPRPCRFGR